MMEIMVARAELEGVERETRAMMERGRERETVLSLAYATGSVCEGRRALLCFTRNDQQ